MLMSSKSKVKAVGQHLLQAKTIIITEPLWAVMRRENMKTRVRGITKQDALRGSQ